MIPQEATLAAAAARYGVPPAILFALGQQQTQFSDQALNGQQLGARNMVGVFGMTPEQVRSFGYQPGQLQGDVALQADLEARLLAQQFQEHGDWQSALSALQFGDPNAYQNATSPAGGFVTGVLAVAGSHADYGLSQMDTSSLPLPAFTAMAQSFASVIAEQAQLGGVVSNQHADSFSHAVAKITGSDTPGPDGSVAHADVAPGSWNTSVVDQLQVAGRNNQQSYTPGQCTWYVARSLGYIPSGLGNAADWAHNAAHQGFTVNSTPAVGTAVVYGAGGNYSGVGHVAVVTAVNPDGTFQVSEMNVDGEFVTDRRTSTMNGVVGFIHPPPGVDMTKAAPGLRIAAQQNPAPQTAQQAHAQQQQRQQASGSQQREQDREPSPQEISDFAGQAKSLGLTAQDVNETLPKVAPLRRFMLERETDLPSLQHYVGMSDQEMLQTVRETPHPSYPNLNAGQVMDTFRLASLHSLPTLRRMPTLAETANFASANLSTQHIQSYYERLAGASPLQPQHEPSAAAQRAQDRGA